MKKIMISSDHVSGPSELKATRSFDLMAQDAETIDISFCVVDVLGDDHITVYRTVTIDSDGTVKVTDITQATGMDEDDMIYRSPSGDGSVTLGVGGVSKSPDTYKGMTLATEGHVVSEPCQHDFVDRGFDGHFGLFVNECKKCGVVEYTHH